jgi:hypothetical protein
MDITRRLRSTRVKVDVDNASSITSAPLPSPDVIGLTTRLGGMDGVS